MPISGKYYGTIASLSGDSAGTATLVSRGGVIAGIYQFEGFSGVETGKLINCNLTDQTFYGHWGDAYGEGDWSVQFTSDFSRFDGGWYEALGAIAPLWNGARSV